MTRSSAERLKHKRERQRDKHDDPYHISLQDKPTPAMRRRQLAAGVLRVPIETIPDELVNCFYAHLPTLRLAIVNANRIDASHSYEEYLDQYFLTAVPPTAPELGERFGLARTTVLNMVQRIYWLFHQKLLIVDPDLIHQAQIVTPSTDTSFWDRVKKDDVPDGCWIWQGATDLGYGVLKRKGRKHQAHRYAYALSVGPLTDGMHLFHTCRVRSCVNPAHLFEGLPGDLY